MIVPILADRDAAVARSWCRLVGRPWPASVPVGLCFARLRRRITDASACPASWSRSVDAIAVPCLPYLIPRPPGTIPAGRHLQGPDRLPPGAFKVPGPRLELGLIVIVVPVVARLVAGNPPTGGAKVWAWALDHLRRHRAHFTVAAAPDGNIGTAISSRPKRKRSYHGSSRKATAALGVRLHGARRLRFWPRCIGKQTRIARIAAAAR